MKSFFLIQHCVYSRTIFAIKKMCIVVFWGMVWCSLACEPASQRKLQFFIFRVLWIWWQQVPPNSKISIQMVLQKLTLDGMLMFWNLFLKGTSYHLSSLWYRRWMFLTLRMRPILPYWSGLNLASLSPNFTVGDSHSMRNVFSWMLTLWQVFKGNN